jgi:hypothetical protein
MVTNPTVVHNNRRAAIYFGLIILPVELRLILEENVKKWN